MEAKRKLVIKGVTDEELPNVLRNLVKKAKLALDTSTKTASNAKNAVLKAPLVSLDEIDQR